MHLHLHIPSVLAPWLRMYIWFPTFHALLVMSTSKEKRACIEDVIGQMYTLGRQPWGEKNMSIDSFPRKRWLPCILEARIHDIDIDSWTASPRLPLCTSRECRGAGLSNLGPVGVTSTLPSSLALGRAGGAMSCRGALLTSKAHS